MINSNIAAAVAYENDEHVFSYSPICDSTTLTHVLYKKG